MYKYDINGDGVIKRSEIIVDPDCTLDGDEMLYRDWYRERRKYSPWLYTPKQPEIRPPETLPPRPESPPKIKPKKDDERYRFRPDSNVTVRNHTHRPRDSI